MRTYARARRAARYPRRTVRIARRIGKYTLLKRRRIPVLPSNKGFLKLYRKLPEMYITNDATPGVAGIVDPTGTCIDIGTPILETALGSGTYTVPFSMKFQLKQLINYTDVTNLCDAYKLKYINIKLSYLSTQASVSSKAIMPNITWIQDHDDANVPASADDLREKMGSKMKTFGFNKLLKIGVQPRVADTILNAGSSPAAYSVAKSLWINAAYAQVDHFAIKGILSNVELPAQSLTNTIFKFDVTALVYGKDFQ